MSEVHLSPTFKRKDRDDVAALTSVQANANKRTRRFEPNFSWSLLPKDALISIFAYFSKTELVKLGAVNKHWRRSSRQQVLWQKIDFTGFKVNSLREITDMLDLLFEGTAPLSSVILPFNCTELYAANFERLTEICPHLKVLDLPPVGSVTKSVDDAAIGAISQFEELQKLNLSTHSAITDSALHSLADNCENLTHLTIEHCRNITPAGVCSVIAKCPRLVALSTLFGASCVFSSDDLELIASHVSRLQQLSIEFGHVDSSSVALFASSAQRLKSLFIRGWRSSTGEALSALCQKLPAIEQLRIICDDTTRLVMPVISSSTLREFTLRKCHVLTKPTFRCSNIKRIQIESIGELHDITLDTPSLSALSFKSCRFVNTSVTKMLFDVPELEVCQIFECAGFDRLQVDSSKLHSLNVFMCGDLEDISLRGDRLRSLSIDVCMSLTNAEIRCANLEKAEIFTLAQPDYPLLNTLHIESSKLTSLSLRRCINLTNVHVSCPLLSALDMSECKNLEGVQLECASLKKLALSAPKIELTSEYMESLARECPSIDMMSIANSPTLSDDALGALCRSWQALQSLMLSNCHNIRMPFVQAARLKGLQIDNCTKLERLVFERCDCLVKLIIKNCAALQNDFLLSTQLLQQAFFQFAASTSTSQQQQQPLLPLLSTLELNNCGALVEPSIRNLDRLVNVSISSCNALRKLNIDCRNIRRIALISCPLLAELNIVPFQRPLSGPLHVLDDVVIQNCDQISDVCIERITVTAAVKKLTLLQCRGIVNLSLNGKSLEHIQFSEMPALRQVSLLCSGSVLKMCNFQNCPSLVSFQSKDLGSPLGAAQYLYQPPIQQQQQQQQYLPSVAHRVPRVPSNQAPSTPQRNQESNSGSNSNNNQGCVPPPSLHRENIPQQASPQSPRAPTSPHILRQLTNSPLLRAQQSPPQLQQQQQQQQQRRPFAERFGFINCASLHDISVAVPTQRLLIAACPALVAVRASKLITECSLVVCPQLQQLDINGFRAYHQQTASAPIEVSLKDCGSRSALPMAVALGGPITKFSAVNCGSLSDKSISEMLHRYSTSYKDLQQRHLDIVLDNCRALLRPKLTSHQLRTVTVRNCVNIIDLGLTCGELKGLEVIACPNLNPCFLSTVALQHHQQQQQQPVAAPTTAERTTVPKTDESSSTSIVVRLDSNASVVSKTSAASVDESIFQFLTANFNNSANALRVFQFAYDNNNTSRAVLSARTAALLLSLQRANNDNNQLLRLEQQNVTPVTYSWYS